VWRFVWCYSNVPVVDYHMPILGFCWMEAVCFFINLILASILQGVWSSGTTSVAFRFAGSCAPTHGKALQAGADHTIHCTSVLVA
jgi:hypothetical protein